MLDHPLGCYDKSRFSSHDAMMQELMAIDPGDGASFPALEGRDNTIAPMSELEKTLRRRRSAV